MPAFLIHQLSTFILFNHVLLLCTNNSTESRRHSAIDVYFIYELMAQLSVTYHLCPSSLLGLAGPQGSWPWLKCKRQAHQTSTIQVAAHISLAKATLTRANVYVCMCWTAVLCGKGLLQRRVEKQQVIHSPHSSHEHIKQLLSIGFHLPLFC